MRSVRMSYIHAMTRIHLGVGEGVGFIDHPTDRETATGLVRVSATAAKGAIRQSLFGRIQSEQEDDVRKRQYDHLTALFGPEADAPTGRAGRLKFPDFLLLCFPVRSWEGTFAWITSPLVLSRYLRDLVQTGTAVETLGIPTVADANDVILPGNSKLVIGDSVYLEDEAVFAASQTADASAWAEFIAQQVFDTVSDSSIEPDWQSIFCERFAIVSDVALRHFCEIATDTTTRIRLDEDKSVRHGPWYVENLPPETILSGPLIVDQPGALRNGGEKRVVHSAEEPTEAVSDDQEDPVEVMIGLNGRQWTAFGGNVSTGSGQARWIIA